MPELILFLVFVGSLFYLKWAKNEWRLAISARIAMAAMLIVTGIAHFVFVKGMAMMLPEEVPLRRELIYFTGVLELLAALGLLIPRFQKITGILIIVFFVVLLPANIYAAFHHVNLETARYDGDGPAYLLFRIPLQLFFISWVYFSAVRPIEKYPS